MKFSIQPRAMMKYMRRHACWLTHQPIQLNNKWWWHKRANKWMRIESETKLARISMEINSYCHYRYYFYQSSNHITRTFTHITVLILLYNFMIIHNDYVLIIANKFWFCAACAISTTITTLLHFVYIGIACATAKIELFVAVVWVCVCFCTCFDFVWSYSLSSMRSVCNTDVYMAASWNRMKSQLEQKKNSQAKKNL